MEGRRRASRGREGRRKGLGGEAVAMGCPVWGEAVPMGCPVWGEAVPMGCAVWGEAVAMGCPVWGDARGALRCAWHLLFGQHVDAERADERLERAGETRLGVGRPGMGCSGERQPCWGGIGP